MDRIENGAFWTNGYSSETHKLFGFLKRILTYLYCTKYDENNIGHSDTQKHVFLLKRFKHFKYFLYRLTQKVSDTSQPFGEKF